MVSAPPLAVNTRAARMRVSCRTMPCEGRCTRWPLSSSGSSRPSAAPTPAGERPPRAPTLARKGRGIRACRAERDPPRGVGRRHHVEDGTAVRPPHPRPSRSYGPGSRGVASACNPAPRTRRITVCRPGHTGGSRPGRPNGRPGLDMMSAPHATRGSTPHRRTRIPRSFRGRVGARDGRSPAGDGAAEGRDGPEELSGHRVHRPSQGMVRQDARMRAAHQPPGNSTGSRLVLQM